MSVLSNKVVLLTGGLGSLGRAQAVALARARAKVLLLDRPGHSEGADIVARMTEEAGAEISFVACDLNHLEEAQRQIAALADNESGIDVLINNAALIINRPFEEFSLTEYEDQVRVNSSAAFALVRACAPGMKAKGYGKIINFCSLTLNGRWDGYVPYVASKGAMLGLTKSLARELGPHGIRVNAISPGLSCLSPRNASSVTDCKSITTGFLRTSASRRGSNPRMWPISCCSSPLRHPT